MTNRLRGTAIELVLIPLECLEALIVGDLRLASDALGHRAPAEWLTARERWQDRVNTLRSNPNAAPWLIHAVIGQPAGVIVGHIGFHNAPDSRGMVEVGYGTLPEYRRLGYARLALKALIEQATNQGAKTIRACILADNHASLATIHSLGFTNVGDYENRFGERELIFERGLSANTDSNV